MATPTQAARLNLYNPMTRKVEVYKNPDWRNSQKPTPMPKARKHKATIDLREFRVPGIDTADIEVVEDGPYPKNPNLTHYVTRMTARTPRAPVTWEFVSSFDAESGMYACQPNAIVTGRPVITPGGEAVGLAVPKTKDPNRMLDFHVYAFAQWLKKNLGRFQ